MLFEYRAIAESDVRANAEQGTFDGYASAFRYVDSYGTAFLKGAFRKTIKDHARDDGSSRIPTVWFHNPDEPVGPITALKEDQRGLAFTSKAIEDGAAGSMTLAHLRGGTPLGMSFAFRRIKDRTATEQDGIDLSTAPEGMTLADVRAITEVAVSEISVLPWTMASQPMATIDDVRQKLPSLLDAIRAGTVSDGDRALVEQLVDAWTARAAAADQHGTPDSRRRLSVELDSLFMDAPNSVLELIAA